MSKPTVGDFSDHSSRKETASDVPGGYSFRFVEVGEPSQAKDEEFRSTIRSHVMRDFYEKQGGRKRQSVPERIAPASTQQGVLQQKFKVGPQGLHEVKKRKKRGGDIPKKTRQSSSANANSHEHESAEDGSCPSIAHATQPKPAVDCVSPISSYFGHEALTTPAISITGNSSLGKRISRGRSGSPNQLTIDPQLLSVGAVAGDPFECLPRLRCPRAQVLLHHAEQGILSSRLMGQLRTKWLQIATQDSALFHVALSHYAGNYSNHVEALGFGMQAMRIVNKRLNDVERAITDTTLSAVASLSSFEATNGSLSAIQTHMKGLERLINLKGGIEDDMNPYARRLVLWADLNCANALGTDPSFPVPHDFEPNNISPPSMMSQSMQKSPSMEHTSPAKKTVKDTETLNRELRDNFTALKHLAKINHRRDRHALSEEEKREMIRDSDRLFLVERNLLTLSNIYPGKFITSGCLAAIIFLDNSLRDIALEARIMGRLVTRLRTSMVLVLEDIPKHAVNTQSTRALMWVLYVGSVAAMVEDDKVWFIGHLREYCDALDMRSWEDIEVLLAEFLWFEAWNDQGRDIWTKVEKALGGEKKNRGTG